MDIYSLPTLTTLSDYITLCEIKGIKVIRIQHPKAKAALSLFGGHLLSFIPNNEKELIWLSENADLSGKKPIRGGVPICWPWFGKAAEPSHGFARNAQWTLNQHRENDQGVIVSLIFENDADTYSIWPFQFHLELQIEVSEKLKINLITTNKSNQSFNYGGALHTYFAIKDIHQTKVTNLGNSYIEAQKTHQSDGVTDFTKEVDRIYTRADQNNDIYDIANDRVIQLQHSGNNAVVVWNPWQELSKSMIDMSDDGYQTMVCVETTNYDRSLELQPKQCHSIQCEISVNSPIPSC